jgi:hypothetical protein
VFIFCFVSLQNQHICLVLHKLGMRPKVSVGQDGDSGKWQHIASVSRLICSAPSKHAAIKRE